MIDIQKRKKQKKGGGGEQKHSRNKRVERLNPISLGLRVNPDL